MFFKVSLGQTSCILTKHSLTLTLLVVPGADPLNKRHNYCFYFRVGFFSVENVTNDVKALL